MKLSAYHILRAVEDGISCMDLSEDTTGSYATLVNMLTCDHKLQAALYQPVINCKTWSPGGPPYIVADLSSVMGPGGLAVPVTPVDNDQLLKGCGGGGGGANRKEANTPADATSIVIDLCFKQRWLMARSTPEYDALLLQTNSVFVGSYAALKDTLERLAQGMAKVFRTTAMELPPWRATPAVLNVFNYRDPCAAQNITSTVQEVPPACRVAEERNNSSSNNNNSSGNNATAPTLTA